MTTQPQRYPALEAARRSLGVAPTDQAPAEEELLTPAEVADLFRVRPRTVTRWSVSGQIPPEAIVRTLGGHRRYRATHIRALLEETGDRRGST
jgi:hypothetical protein